MEEEEEPTADADAIHDSEEAVAHLLQEMDVASEASAPEGTTAAQLMDKSKQHADMAAGRRRPSLEFARLVGRHFMRHVRHSVKSVR